jgi:hypothetical protein
METQQLQRRSAPQPGNNDPDAGANGASLTQQLASLTHLADTIDQVVDSATMVNAETFSTQFRQAGGQ